MMWRMAMSDRYAATAFGEIPGAPAAGAGRMDQL